MVGDFTAVHVTSQVLLRICVRMRYFQGGEVSHYTSYSGERHRMPWEGPHQPPTTLPTEHLENGTT